ncbi:cobalamin biosynthesis protein CobD [Pseudodesulfovibrio cashew]|uniref:Cobalamin biosynthesis protein CobD n=1 Tax=Pseudodesulfovibrio cashew TaxID=2678688 RepID=A0A6I6JJA9_9BACT|nr:adenosylcobinamide-phosphate synthase CbiB [Pseudodesulfovibrio cashew]QGY41160.1 cobalamin biosynthesis protein CobD [Pseudodesulfovibrio cashew]
MESAFYVLLLPALAVFLDARLGDPHHFPHPVRFIGKGLDSFEYLARKIGRNLHLAGFLALVLFPLAAWGLVAWLMVIPYVGFLIGLYFAYAGLALGCLLRECREVASKIDRGDLSGARMALSMLVSRDTDALDEQGIRRTLAETLSENLNDGFVAPLFYLVLLGPGGMWAYKTVSTMDSMWGYKTEAYRKLGFAAAKTDDILAYVPARITAWLLLSVGKGRGLDADTARRCFRKDAAKMESPNAGWPMAAAAWLLQGQMGGATVYFGKVKEKPVLGPEGKLWDASMIRKLIAVCQATGYRAAWIFILLFGGIQTAF